MLSSRTWLALVLTLSLTSYVTTLFGRGNGVVEADLRQLEEFTGSNFCSDGTPLKIEQSYGFKRLKNSRSELLEVGEKPLRTLLLDDFANNRDLCVDLGKWPSSLLASGELTHQKSMGFFQFEQAKLPIIATRPVNGGTPKGTYSGIIIVRLSGGPGGIAIHPVSDFIISPVGAELLIDLFHTGNGMNLVYPSPNFETSLKQIDTFIRRLKSMHPRSKIVVYGESLGGLSALASLSSNADVDKLVLLNPLAISPSDFIQSSKKEASKFTSAELAENYRVLEDSKDDWSTHNIMSLNRIDVLGSYFDTRHMQIDIVERLRHHSGAKVLLIYGTADRVVGVEKLQRLKPSRNLTIEVVEGMGHQPTTFKEVQQVSESIDEFIYD